jgi:hypothetical protein
MSAVARLVESFARKRRPLRVLGASGQLGYGIPAASFEAGLAREPDMIGCDMGSIDIGPAYLGSGRLATTEQATKRDLRRVLQAARRLDVPLVIGSAGSAGGAPHLAATLDLVRAIASEDGLHFKLASIRADLSPNVVKAAVRAGRVHSLDGMPPLDEDEVDQTANLVGQMGVEAFRRALEAGADVVIAGRACDTGIFAALPAILGFPIGLAMHMAKIVECASLCCLPGGRDPILATLDDEGFDLESMARARRATPVSVAAHSLYEQSDPYEVLEPDGMLDLREARYVALDERRTRVSGAVWHDAKSLTIKMEGARLLGHRALLLAGSADPRFIAQHERILEDVKEVVRGLVCENAPQDYQLFFRVYGVNGVHDWPNKPDPLPREIFVLGECIADTPDRAAAVTQTTKQYLLHHGYEGRLSTGGNLAFPVTPPEVAAGPAYAFNVFHLMEVDGFADLFPVQLEDL